MAASETAPGSAADPAVDPVADADAPGAPTPRFPRYDCSGGCPVEGALEQISGKWKGLILHHLLDGTLRFNALSRRVGPVTQRSLTKQLRELEADGIVTRRVHAEVPPRVEYSLTEKGLALRGVIAALGDWGAAHPRPRP